MTLHSIKWRLQLWHGSLLVLLVAGLMTGFYTYAQREKFQTIDVQLNEAIMRLLPRYAPPVERGGPEGGPGDRSGRPPRNRAGDGSPPEERPDRELEPRGERAPIGPGYNSERIYFAVWAGDGALLFTATNAPAQLRPPVRSGDQRGRFYQTRDHQRELIHFIPDGRCLLVGTSLETTLAELHQLAAMLALIGVGIVAVGLTVGGWLVARSLRPIAEISQAAQKIAAGDLSKRINSGETESELGQLTTVLNSTFARLEAAFAQQQQFTSDAAHELRTPVSVILTQVQSTLNKERTGAEYRETLEACQRAAQRMRRLIESLLELARFDAGQEHLERRPFDLSAVAQDCVEMLSPLASEKLVKLKAELPPTQCRGDGQRISQVLANLLTNAVTYNRPGGEVRLSLTTENGFAVVSVTDTGAGIAPEDTPHVFKRFYRADKSRGGPSGNAGLGLAICQKIVVAHGGTLEFQSEAGQGTTFTLRLPRVEASRSDPRISGREAAEHE